MTGAGASFLCPFSLADLALTWPSVEKAPCSPSYEPWNRRPWGAPETTQKPGHLNAQRPGLGSGVWSGWSLRSGGGSKESVCVYSFLLFPGRTLELRSSPTGDAPALLSRWEYPVFCFPLPRRLGDLGVNSNLLWFPNEFSVREYVNLQRKPVEIFHYFEA